VGLARRLLTVAGFSLLAVRPAAASPITAFDFDTLNAGVTNATILTYMQGILDATMPGKHVTSVSGATSNKSYTGDGHAVGPAMSGKVKPITLGSTDGALGNNTDQARLNASNAIIWDTFIKNNGSTTVTMIFDFPIERLKFDWQIFPSGTCPRGGSTGCPNTSDPDWPDFTFEVNDNQIFKYYGVKPGDVGLSGMTYDRSQLRNPERAPQALGTTGWIDLDVRGSSTKLEFIDWPLTIGIDNLHIQIPEPSTGALFGAVLALLAAGSSIGARRRSG
jgi:hypothetical protein